MKRSPSLSAALITLNEEGNLLQLLPALAWADEIVVVDGGSSDATVEVARAHGCRVLEHRFDNFAAQRNRALKQSRCDWVFSIDADERPTLPGIQEILQSIARTRYMAFRIRIRSNIFGRRMRFCGTQDDRPVRLFRRDKACWAGEVHEVLQVAGPVGCLNAALEHQTLPDLSAFLAKMNRYATLEASRRQAGTGRPRWRDQWLAPPREVLRRLIWKQGWLDGPQGWAFCLLSGLSEWVVSRKHRELHSPELSHYCAAVSSAPFSRSLVRSKAEPTPRRPKVWQAGLHRRLALQAQ